MSNQVQVSQETNKSVLVRFAERYQCDAKKIQDALINTVFKPRPGDTVSPIDQMAFLILCDRYNLDPFCKEIYPMPDPRSGRYIPIVGVDGWFKIASSNPSHNGHSFTYCDTTTRPDGDAKECPEWIECTIYRRDWEHAVSVREYLTEAYRPAFKGKRGPWQTHTIRMLRHKAFTQCCRQVYGIGGIYEEDEGQRIIEAGNAEVVIPEPVLYSPAPVVEAEPAPVVEVEPAPVVEVEPAPVVEVEPAPVVEAQIEERKLTFIKNVISYGRQKGSWAAAEETFRDRLKNDANALAYALNELRAAQAA